MHLTSRPRPRRRIAALLSLAMLLPLAQVLPAAATEPSMLDTTFGVEGSTTLSVDGAAFVDNAPVEVLVQPDGKIIVVGTVPHPGPEQSPGRGHDIYVARLLPDGSLDLSFADVGYTFVNLRADDRSDAATLLSDGSIAVVGSSASGTSLDPGAHVLTVSRISATGELIGWDQPYVDGDIEGMFPSSAADVAVHRDTAGAEWLYVVGTAGTDDSAAYSNDVVLARMDAFTLSTDLVGGWLITTDIALADNTYAPEPSDDRAAGLALTPSGDAIVVGALRGAGADTDWDEFVVKYTASGAIADGFGAGGDGVTTRDTAEPLAGEENGGQSVAIDDAGHIVVLGRSIPFSGGTNAFTLAHYTESGVLATSAEGSGGFDTTGTLVGTFVDDAHAQPGEIMINDHGMILAVGSSRYWDGTNDVFDVGVARFDYAGYDAAFSADGRHTLSCGAIDGGASAVAQQSDGRYLTGGLCGGSIQVLRLQGDAVVDVAGDAISNVTLSVTGTPDAGHETTDPNNIDPAAILQGTSSALQSVPVRNTPVRNTPVRNTPVRNTPVRNTPVRNTALADPALPPVLLSSVRLLNGETWDLRLVGTRYEGAPLQSVTLQDLLAITSPDPLAGLTLQHIAIEDTPVRNTSFAAMLLSGVALVELPVPGDDWCAYLAAESFNCTNGVDPTSTTLLALELNSVDLTAYYATPLSLPGVDLSQSTLGTFTLIDVNIPATPFAATPTSEAPDLCGAGGCTSATLGEAHTAGEISDAATLTQLVGKIGTLTTPTDISLGELIRGLFAADELPVEDLPIDAVLDAADIRNDRLLTFETRFNLDCSDAEAYKGGFAALVTTASGVRLQGGSYFHVTSSASALRVSPTAAEYEMPTWTDAGGGDFALDAPLICQQAGGGVHQIVTGFQAEPFALLEPLAGSVTVTATSSGGSAAAPPVLVADGAEPDDSEDADGALTAARQVAPGRIYTGYLNQPGDVDYYQFQVPDPGSLVTVTLSHLPSDYDLVLYGPEDGIEISPVRNTPVRNTPVRNTSLDDASAEPGADSSVLPPEGLQDIPVRNTPVRNTSLQRGTNAESVTTLVLDGDENQPFTVQVSGHDDASSAQPYVMNIRVTPPLAPLPCATRDYTATGVPGTLFRPATLTDDGAIQTLILVNRERLGRAHGGDPSALMTQLESFAARVDVSGLVIPVEQDAKVAAAYAAWDQTPCSVAAANDVVEAINGYVDTIRTPEMTDLRHMVIVGHDEIIPMGRLPDRTVIGNEGSYTRDVAVNGEDNALSSALGQRNVPSDDPYGDFDPVGFTTGTVYVPDVALGRLVETPAEISAAISQYTDPVNDGRLNPSSAATTGYDFLTDGAKAVHDALSAEIATATADINETWTSSEAVTALNASDRIASVNAHYDHDEGLPAKAFNENSIDLFDTGDLAVDGVVRSILFTMGCHSGLNVPDVYIGGTGQLADWPQALAAEGAAAYVGNTGYGYGDTDVVGYSERLMAYNAENVVSGGMTVGQALMFAKQRYFAELGVPGDYDAKAMQEATFYGLPMYRIGTGGVAAPSVAPQLPDSSTAPTEVLETETVTIDPKATAVTTSDGTYWVAKAADGAPLPPQVSHYRPIQPRVELDVTGTTPVHGFLIEHLTSTDVLDVTPVRSQPVIDDADNETKRPPAETVFPASIQRVTSQATPMGWRDKLVLVSGQFISDGDTGHATGTQRLFTRIGGTVYRSDSTDWLPAAISSFDAFTSGSAAQFIATTPAEHDDVLRAVVHYRDDVSNAWRKTELARTEPGRWTGGAALVSGATKVRESFLQFVDEGGNVSLSTNKGELFESQILPGPSGDLQLALSSSVPPSGYYSDTLPTVEVDGPSTYSYRVNGGPWTEVRGAETETSTSIELGADIGDGVQVVEVTSAQGSGAILVPIDRQGPQITVVSPIEGHAYENSATVLADFSCADALSGVRSCVGTVAPAEAIDTSEGDHTFTVTATDFAGHQTVRSVVYNASAEFLGFYAPVSGDGTRVEDPAQRPYNAVKAGSTVPIKFNLRRATGLETDPANVSVAWNTYTCDNATSTTSTVTETVSETGSGEVRWDPVEEQFIYGFKTQKNWERDRMCADVTVTFVNGPTKVAYFMFTK